MNTYTDKISERKSEPVAGSLLKQQSSDKPEFHLQDNRPATVAQRKIQDALRQKQQPAMQLKSTVQINDDTALEKEADNMGAKALSVSRKSNDTILQKKKNSAPPPSSVAGYVQRQVVPENSRPKFGTLVLQRQIEYNATDKVYETNSSRPGWRKNAEDALLDEYNIRHNLTQQKLEYAKLKLDRCHIVAFEDIQTQMALYLNGSLSAGGFGGFIDLITEQLGVSSGEKRGVTDNWRLLQDEVKGSNTGPIVSVANSLLSRLNSISENLRAGNKYLNSYIQQNLDLLFEKTSSGQYRLTDHSRNIVSKGGSMVSGVLRTPEHQSRLVTSEGPIPFGSMTPQSKKLTESHPFETRAAKSSNVREPLYGKKPGVMPVRNYLSQPAVNPLVLKLQPKVDWKKLELVKLKKQESDLRAAMDNLLRTSKPAYDYSGLQQHKLTLNRQYGNMMNSLFAVNSDLQGLIPQYHQNTQTITALSQQRNAIQMNMQRTVNVNNYEQHEQYANQQMNLHQSGFMADAAGYNNSVGAMQMLSGHQDVGTYLSQRQQIDDLDFRINNLQNGNNRIAGIYQYKQRLQNDLNNLNQETAKVNGLIFNLESSQDVGDFKLLKNNLALTLGAIETTNQEITQLQQELKKII